MKYISTLVIMLQLGVGSVFAQEMPAVFDKSFSERENAFREVMVGNDGHIVAVGGGANGIITKCGPTGEIIFNKAINKGGLVMYRDVKEDTAGNVIAVGGGSIAYGNGRISKFTPKGEVIFDKSLGSGVGGYFSKILIDPLGNYIVIGTDGSKPARARIARFTAKGQLVYDNPFNLNCAFTDALLDDDGNIVVVGGDVGNREGKAVVAKFNSKGEPLFSREMAAAGAWYSKVLLLADGSILAMGGGAYGTGNPCRISKFRGDDGQVVFDKGYSNTDGHFTDVSVNEAGQIVACSEEYEKGRVIKLRQDGTEIYNKTFGGPLYSLQMNSNGDVVAVGGDKGMRSGRIVKIKADGAVQYDNTTEAALQHMLLSEDGEVYATSVNGYQLFKYAPDGGLMFSKKNGEYTNDTRYEKLMLTPSGELVIAGGGHLDGGRLAKITHGIAISDIVVSEPLNGVSMATLSVSLTGFLRSNGVRTPVRVAYKTISGKGIGFASADDFKETISSLSFVPSDYAVGTPVVQSIEIPVNSDNFLEGAEKFSVQLSDPENIYITKREGTVTVIDQPANVKLVGGTDGKESGLQPVNFIAGIFKSDNTPLINQTGGPVKLGYSFGNGTATAGADFVATTKIPFIIQNGSKEGTLQVAVKDDNNFEQAESVVLQLNDLSGLNECRLSFPGGTNNVSSIQFIKDQPATVKVVRLSNRNGNVTTPSGMFKFQLVKDTGNITETNCSGSDIAVTYEIDPSSTAAFGRDFVILDGNVVKIAGNCDNADVDLKVAVINTQKKDEKQAIVLKISTVEGPSGARHVGIHPDEKQNRATAYIIR